MPRPKRAKVTPSVPAARRVAAKPTLATATSRTVTRNRATPQPVHKQARHREELRRAASPAESDMISSDSGRSLVRSPKRSGLRVRTLQRAEHRMSGALPVPVTSAASETLQRQGRPEEEKGANHGREAGKGAGAREPELPPKRHAVRMTAEEKQRALEALKRRANDATEALRKIDGQDNIGTPERPSSRTRATENAENHVPSTAGKRTGSRQNTQPPGILSSASKPLGTPAVDSSALLANFKRRPRQPSILRMVQQQSSPQADTSDIGSLGDFDDFNPDDESTPLHSRKELSAIRHSLASQQQSSGSRKRKRGSPSAQVLNSSPPPSVQVLGSPSLPAEHPRSSSQPGSAVSDSDSLPGGMVPDTQRSHPDQEQQSEPAVWSETMAPPLSSSPVPSQLDGSDRVQNRPAVSPRNAGASVRRANTRGNTSAMSKAANGEGGKRGKKPQPSLSTADLTALLPQRRRPVRRMGGVTVRDAFDIPSTSGHEDDRENVDALSGIDDDEDELQATRPSKPSSRRATVVTAKPASALRTPAKPSSMKKGKGNSGPGSAKKGTGTKAATSAKTAAATTVTTTNRRTYGRRSGASDKENEESTFVDDGQQENSELLAAKQRRPHRTKAAIEGAVSAQSAELDAARKKFEEVDAWEMEFESADVGGESSPWR